MSTLPQLEKLSFTLQHMVIFRMVARSGSIKDAAMALSLSPGAVSKSIAALEQVRPAQHGDDSVAGSRHCKHRRLICAACRTLFALRWGKPLSSHGIPG